MLGGDMVRVLTSDVVGHSERCVRRCGGSESIPAPSSGAWHRSADTAVMLPGPWRGRQSWIRIHLGRRKPKSLGLAEGELLVQTGGRGVIGAR